MKDRSPKYRWLIFIISVLPSIALVESLQDPLPHGYRGGIEIAGYFQMLAILRDGLDSYTYLTPAESSAGVHFHSLLSAMLYATGLDFAGRVVSILSAIGAAIAVAYLASEYIDYRAGILAPIFLWAHPLFLRFSVSWMPEALGIALTTGAVVFAYEWVETDRQIWLIMSSGLLIFGVWNHTWEASIALPLVVLYTFSRRYRAAVGTCVLTLLAVGSNFAVRGLQPAGHNLIQDYSIFYHSEQLVTFNWLLHGGINVWRPWEYSIIFLIPMSLIALATTLVVVIRTNDTFQTTLASWFISGIIILVLLPRGWIIHGYYGWALLVPLALFSAWLVTTAISRVPDTKYTIRTGTINSQQLAALGLAVVLVVATIGYGGTAQADALDRNFVPAKNGYTWGQGYQSKAAGQALETNGVNNVSSITFVGPWGLDKDPRLIIRAYDVARVLIYSRALMRSKYLNDSEGPRFVDSVKNATDCDWRVVAPSPKNDPSNRTVSIERCSK